MLAAFQELGSVPAVERPLEVCVSRTHFKFAKCIYTTCQVLPNALFGSLQGWSVGWKLEIEGMESTGWGRDVCQV